MSLEHLTPIMSHSRKKTIPIWNNKLSIFFTLFLEIFLASRVFSIGSVYIRDEPIRSLTWQVLLWQISLKGGEKIIIRFSRVAVNALFELSQYYWFLSNFCWAKTSGTSLMHHLYFLSHHHSHHHYTRLCAWSSPSSTKHASIYFSSCIPVLLFFGLGIFCYFLVAFSFTNLVA